MIYKIDRFSRSLIDFTKMMEMLETHGVSLVAVTQHINTTTSTGRLMLNILSSFAQFERELISERTRDKIAASRRKGKWTGGHPLLGYDIVRGPGGSKLAVNDDEAEAVRQMFDLYLEHQALLPVVRELDRRGWVTKRWTTSKGEERGGKCLDKTRLYNLLTNVVYVGKVRHHENVYEGEHSAIVDEAVFNRVQQVLVRNGRTGGAAVRNKYGALLRGLLHCKPCGCAMSHSFSTNRNKRYRYYRCCIAGKRGHDTCPAPSVPAEQIEQFVVNQIKAIGKDPALVRQTLAEAAKQTKMDLKRLQTEEKAIRRRLQRDGAELAKIAVGDNGQTTARLADLQDRISSAEQRLAQVQSEISVLQDAAIDEPAAIEALRQFDPVWDQLAPREQTRLIQLLVDRIDYDGAAGSVAITFHTDGFGALSGHADTVEEGVAA